MSENGHDDGQLELPLYRLFRASDPDTSLEAAIKASKASRKAVAAVRAVLEGERLRGTDEDIWRACRRNGYIASDDTTAHGRLALVEAGLVVDTGERRETVNGVNAIVWAWVDGDPVPAPRVQLIRASEVEMTAPPS